MDKKILKQELIDFENRVIEKYKEGNTYGPVHLSGGNEEQLIEIFKDIKNEDWVFSTHRAHYHSLLKSKDKNWLMNEIIDKANSSHINSKKYKIFTSAIVGGIIPIALGVAMGIKMKKKKEKVWCFVGDMAAEMGCFWEALKYAIGEKLPIVFIIENNNIGCNTPTNKVWKVRQRITKKGRHVIFYDYKRTHGHYGIGEWVIFKKKKFKSQGDYSSYNVK